MICLHARSLFLMLALCAIAEPVPARQPGDGEPKRPREALEKAAVKGDAEGQYQLGVLLQRSANTPPERALALSWLRKAAGQGHMLAQHQLGLASSTSRDAERNLPLAVKWLRKAAEQGHAEAWLALGDVYGEGGPGVPQDLDAARKCYQKADERGKEAVWHSLGNLYRNGGGGIAADWPQALAFYLKAAKRGHRESQYVLGQFHQYGIGTTADMARAVYWYTEAARQGDRWAEEKLGWLYEHGLGVARDREKALAWYRKAEQHGGFCNFHLTRLGDPAAQKQYPPDPPDRITREVEITLRPDKAEYDLDDIIIIAIHYRNVGKETWSFTDCHTGGFQVPFVVKDEKGRQLANPYEEPSHIGFSHSVHSTQVLQPGKTLVIKKTLNQCVHFESPGTYTVSTSTYVYAGERGVWGKEKVRRSAEAKPLVLKVRHSDPTKKQQADIARLVKAYRGNKKFPAGLTPPVETFGFGLDILRRLVFYNEPGLLPLFLDALELDHGADIAETGLRALPGQAAVLKALEERLGQPERYRVFDLLYPYFRLSGLAELDWFGEPSRLDKWKRQEEITRKVRDKAMQLLRGDARYRYGYLVPGLLGGSDDLFLIGYLIRCKPGLDLVRRCSRSIQRVKLGREHVPFLESLLRVERDWNIADAGILQLVRLDRTRYLPQLKARKENFSPAIARFLLELQED